MNWLSRRSNGARLVAARSEPGLTTALYAVFVAGVAIASALVLSRLEPLLVHGALDPRFARGFGVAVAIVLALELLGGVFSLGWQLLRVRHSPGRGRLTWLAIGGCLHALAGATTGFLLYRRLRFQDLVAGFGISMREPYMAMYWASLGLLALGAAISCVNAAAAWPLIPHQRRKQLWWLVDSVLLIATLWAIVYLPAEPRQHDPGSLRLAATRHATTTLFTLRLLVRVLPWSMNLIERLGFQPMLAARHLRSKKSGFLAAISLLSILAVTVSCCALTTTLSVMGGFRADLKRKILGNKAHIVVDRERGSIESWAPLVKAAREQRGVVGVSPYVGGEVMLSSASNLGTALLHGVDPSLVGQVNDLRKNLKSGRLEYLDQPEKLLDLAAETTTGDALFHPLRDSEALNQSDPAATPPANAAAAVAPSAAQPPKSGVEELTARTRDLEEELKKLDALLRDEQRRDPDSPRSGAKPKEVLPGIIIGQELARALRLYLGDEVNVVAPLGALGPSGPMPKARAFRVAGIFYSGMYEYDMKFTYVALGTAQRFLNVDRAISGLEIKVQNVEAAPAVAARLRDKLHRPDLRVRDWQELNSQLFGALALEKLAMFVALGVAILVASFCIAGTLTLMVQEKGREVAILKAMGTSDRSIVGVFVVEGGLIGLFGAALGLFLGYMACFAAEHFGIRMNPEVYYIDRLPVHIDPTEFALTGIAAIAICLLVTIYPALLASRLRPVDALRYE